MKVQAEVDASKIHDKDLCVQIAASLFIAASSLIMPMMAYLPNNQIKKQLGIKRHYFRDRFRLRAHPWRDGTWTCVHPTDEEVASFLERIEQTGGIWEYAEDIIEEVNTAYDDMMVVIGNAITTVQTEAEDMLNEHIDENRIIRARCFVRLIEASSILECVGK